MKKKKNILYIIEKTKFERIILLKCGIKISKTFTGNLLRISCRIKHSFRKSFYSVVNELMWATVNLKHIFQCI